MHQEGVPGRPPQGVGLAWLVTETTIVQALGTAAVLTVPVLAPEIARTLDFPAGQVGYQVALVYLAAMTSSLLAGSIVASFGPCRTSQIAMLLTAAGCGLAGIPRLAAMAAGSLLIGCAYGLINPAASDLLARHAPPGRRNFIFSIKQTGVPLGGLVAGLVGPPLALSAGWPTVLWAAAALGVIAAAAAQPHRAVLDAHRSGLARSRGHPFAGLKTLVRHRRAFYLCLASFCFSAVQLSFVAFLVVLLVNEVGVSLIVAGAILSGAQAAGAVGRLSWGLLADAVRDGQAVLLGLALLMAGAASCIMFVSPAWPLAALVVVLLLLGLSALGWNGVFLSEIARVSPPESVGSTTGAAMFLTFMGVVCGPPLFSAAHGVIGSYTRSYGLLVGVALAGAAMIVVARTGRD